MKNVRENSFFLFLFTKNFNFLSKTIDESLISELINEGFGINQTIYLLTKVLRPEASVLLIEESEIHLHPTAQSKLIEALVKIVENENKTLIISTHSERIISSLFSLVVESKISHNQMEHVIYAKKKGEELLFKNRRLTPKDKSKVV